MIAKIPFRVIELEPDSFHIVIDGKIEDVESIFIVDTGASRTIIDRCYVDNLEKLKIGTENPMATGISSEQIPVELYNISKLVLSDVLFSNVHLLAADLTAINEIYMNITGKKIGGLIGCDFLLEKVKNIDFKKKLMSVKTKKQSLQTFQSAY